MKCLARIDYSIIILQYAYVFFKQNSWTEQRLHFAKGIWKPENVGHDILYLKKNSLLRPVLQVKTILRKFSNLVRDRALRLRTDWSPCTNMCTISTRYTYEQWCTNTMTFSLEIVVRLCNNFPWWLSGRAVQVSHPRGSRFETKSMS